MSYCHEQGGFASGDRVGVLLDLDAGCLRFYHNKRRGPGDEVATSCTHRSQWRWRPGPRDLHLPSSSH